MGRAAEEWTEEWTAGHIITVSGGGESELESTLTDLGRAEEEGWRVVFVCCFHTHRVLNMKCEPEGKKKKKGSSTFRPQRDSLYFTQNCPSK